jgi:hypothetical protein
MHHIAKIQEFYLILLTGSFLAFVVSFWLLVKRKSLSLTRTISLGILIAVTTNILFFYNPLFFRISSDILKAKDIDWRQADALSKEIYRFRKNTAVKYLAVGNSQTGAIYSSYAKEEPRLSVFTMAGMGPLDFVLYKDMIKSLCNGTIILTLSDFDLGREPSLLGAKLSPPQGIQLFKITSLLWHEPNITYSEVQDFIFANIADAYRYQYIFKGFADKLFARKKAFPGEDLTAISDAEYLKIHLKNLSMLDRTWFPINLVLLEQFISWANENSLKVAIVEGGYHPRALDANIALHGEASVKLELLCKRYMNCSYYKSSQLYKFAEDDYRDGYHVKKDSGWKFTKKLMSTIGNGQPAILD